MKVHEKIRELREQKNWSQEEMALQLNMSSGGYAKIERGETRLNLPRLEQIAEIFHIDIIELLKSDEQNVIYQFNEEGDNHNNISYHHQDNSLRTEIEKLSLIIEHQNTLLKQQERELAIQQELITILKQKDES